MSDPDRKPKSSAMAPGEIVGLLALAVTLLAALWLAQRYLHGLGERALSDGKPVGEAIGQMRLFVMVAAALVLASAGVLGRLVWRIGNAAIAQQHFPPSGVANVETRSERDGADAVKLGRTLCTLGMAIAAIGVIAAVCAAIFALRL